MQNDTYSAAFYLQYVESILEDTKKETCKRTGPLNLYQCDNYSSTAACAAARRAMGTRNGEQET